MRGAGAYPKSLLFGEAVCKVRSHPNASWPGLVDFALFRFFVPASGFVLLSELGPGLSHFDQQGFVSLVRSFPGQAQAFGRAPLMVLEFGHGPLPLRRNTEDCGSVPCNCECGQVGPCLATLLVKIAGNASRC